MGDGLMYRDKPGSDPIYVQANRWSDNNVQSKEVREFISSVSLRGINRGMFITPLFFTEEAKRTASMNPQNTTLPIDGKKRTDFAIQANAGVQVKRPYEFNDVDRDFFDEL